MITADANYTLKDDTKLFYTAFDIVVEFRFSDLQQMFYVSMFPYEASLGTLAELSTSFTKATVDAKTGSGTNPSDKLLDQVEQCCIDYLDGLGDNSGVNFTN
jgi:hypothetical protein